MVLGTALGVWLLGRSTQVTLAIEPNSSERISGPYKTGEYGAALQSLERFYHPPKSPAESNHLFDMWSDQKLAFYTRQGGLTNNHTLFINAHGNRHHVDGHARYAVVPHRTLFEPDQEPPKYSARDLAAFLGPQSVSSIHIILLSGCDEHHVFNAREWREAFPNATNIIHAPAGQPGYQPMLLQVLFSPSSQNKPLFQTEQINDLGQPEYYLTRRATAGATKFSPYLAELFLPGETQPYRRQVAGRELFEAESAR